MSHKTQETFAFPLIINAQRWRATAPSLNTELRSAASTSPGIQASFLPFHSKTRISGVKSRRCKNKDSNQNCGNLEKEHGNVETHRLSNIPCDTNSASLWGGGVADPIMRNNTIKKVCIVFQFGSIMYHGRKEDLRLFLFPIEKLEMVLGSPSAPERLFRVNDRSPN